MLALDIIRRALRIVGVIASGETPNSDDITDALGTLNALLAEWNAAGIAIPDAAIPSEAYEMAAPTALRDAMAYQLAFRIGPEYGFDPTRAQAAAADESFSRLRLYYFTPGVIDLSELPCTWQPFDITTG